MGNSSYTIIRCKKILNKYAGGILKPRLELYVKLKLVILNQMDWQNQQACAWGYPGEGLLNIITPFHAYFCEYLLINTTKFSVI